MAVDITRDCHFAQWHSDQECLPLLQDKVGPFARSAADVAVVLDIIRGRDSGDPSSFDTHLDDPFAMNVQNLTVGYLSDTPTTVSFSLPPLMPAFPAWC